MRRKKIDKGNLYIGISMFLSVILVGGGIMFREFRKDEEYKPLAAEKNSEIKDKLFLLFTKNEKLEEICFLDINENKIIGNTYPKEFLVESEKELIKLERLYTKENKLKKDMIKKNFNVEDFAYIEVNIDIISKYIKYDKDFINNIFFKSSELTSKEQEEFYKGFNLIDGKVKLNKEEYKRLIESINKNNFKVKKAEFKTVTLAEIIDKNAIEILTDEEKKIKISYKNEEQLKNYKGYIDIKEKEKIKLKEKKEEIKNNLVDAENNSSNGYNTVNESNNSVNSSLNSKPSTNNTTKPSGGGTKPPTNKPSGGGIKPPVKPPTSNHPTTDEEPHTKPPVNPPNNEEPLNPPEDIS